MLIILNVVVTGIAARGLQRQRSQLTETKRHLEEDQAAVRLQQIKEFCKVVGS